MVDETPEVKVKLDLPKTDPKTPSLLKSARESLGALFPMNFYAKASRH